MRTASTAAQASPSLAKEASSRGPWKPASSMMRVPPDSRMEQLPELLVPRMWKAKAMRES